MGMLLVALLVTFGQDKEAKPSQVWTGGCHHHDSKITEKRFVRVIDQAAWEKLWREHTGDKDAKVPKVDFEKEMVIACFFNRCGWLQSHETGYVYKSLKAEDKGTVTLKLEADISELDYACGAVETDKPASFWIGVLPRGKDKVNVVVDTKIEGVGGKSVAEIP